MRATTSQAQEMVSKLSLEDKVKVTSGHDFWTTKAFADAGIPSGMLTDGPHGLRKQASDTGSVGLANSIPATCFPTAVTLGSTWDPALVERVGRALGSESRTEDVAVLLGPGLNIKRHPAGGRSFEYFSEDPLVSGKMAGALVRGIQSQGVGACLKHYAVNNQEANRQVVDVIVDERTLREIYLTGFEIAVKESDPWSAMCAYNQVNGTHAGENRELLTDILRDDWGFSGAMMTDWGATYQRVEAIKAGLDLEMPGSFGAWDEIVMKAVSDGVLTEQEIETAAVRVVDLILRGTSPDRAPATPTDFDAHHALAREAATAGTVLLTNNGILPLSTKGSVAVIGEFARTPRYQGSGSSLVKPTRLDAALDAISARHGGSVTFAPGYDITTGATTEALLREAVEAASSADVVIVLAGLPNRYESEGFDRENLSLPGGHDAVIEAVCAANAATVIVLQNGSAVVTPWADAPAAIVESYLGGQAGGSALADVLFGDAEPGGRLAESFPQLESHIPASKNFPGQGTQVEYREGLYVGYRFHDVGEAARFAFGHGLSYTSFEYSGLAVKKSGENRVATVTVTNTGKRAGSDVVQIYVRAKSSSVYRPDKELKAFAKVQLAPGASETVALTLEPRAFAIWDVTSHSWAIEAGEYEILAAASSVDVRATAVVKVASTDKIGPSAGPAAHVATDAEFRTMLGHDIPTPLPLLPFHTDSTISHLKQTTLGKVVYRGITSAMDRQIQSTDDEDTAIVMKAMIEHSPLRAIAMMSGGRVSFRSLNRILSVLNGASLKARKAAR